MHAFDRCRKFIDKINFEQLRGISGKRGSPRARDNAIHRKRRCGMHPLIPGSTTVKGNDSEHTATDKQ